MHLSDYMAVHELSDDTVAQAIGVSRATVSRFRRRKLRPRWAVAERIKQFTRGHCTPDDFLDSVSEATQ